MVSTRYRVIVPIRQKEDFSELLREFNSNWRVQGDPATVARQTEWFVALNASKFNGNHQDCYAVDMNYAKTSEPSFPKEVYSKLNITLLDEIPLVRGKDLGLIDIIQTSNPQSLVTLAGELVSSWNGRIFKGNYPVAPKSDLANRSDSHMGVFYGDSEEKARMIKILENRYGSDFSLATEESKAIITFSKKPVSF